HHQRGCGLVAAAEQDDAVDRIRPDRFLYVHAREVPEEHRGRTDAGFAERHHGELERQAAGFPYAALDVLGDLAEMRVARGQLRPRVADADDRTAVEHVRRKAAADPASMNEAVFVALGEPGARSKVAGRALWHAGESTKFFARHRRPCWRWTIEYGSMRAMTPDAALASVRPTRVRYVTVAYAMAIAVIMYLDRVYISQAAPAMRTDL